MADTWDPERLYRVASIMGRCAPLLQRGDLVRIGIEGDPCFRGASADGEHETGTVKWVRKHDDGLVEFGLETHPDRSERTLTNRSVEPDQCWEVHPSFVEQFRGRALEMQEETKQNLFERVDSYARRVYAASEEDGERTELAPPPRKYEGTKSETHVGGDDGARSDDAEAIAHSEDTDAEREASPKRAPVATDTEASLSHLEERMRNVEQQALSLVDSERRQREALEQRLAHADGKTRDLEFELRRTQASVEACMEHCHQSDQRTVEKMRKLVLGMRHICADIAHGTNEYSTTFVEQYDHRNFGGATPRYGRSVRSTGDAFPEQLLYSDFIEANAEAGEE